MSCDHTLLASWWMLFPGFLTSSNTWWLYGVFVFPTDHTHTACMTHMCKQQLCQCCVILLGSNKHIKCLSWTRAELWWIMITISQSTICVLRKGIKRQCLKWRKQQHLCLASDYITHHVDLLITTGTSLLQWIFCFRDGGILTELSFRVCMKNTKYIT